MAAFASILSLPKDECKSFPAPLAWTGNRVRVSAIIIGPKSLAPCVKSQNAPETILHPETRRAGKTPPFNFGQTASAQRSRPLAWASIV